MTEREWDLDTVVWLILLGGLIIAAFLITISLAWQWVRDGTFGSFPPISATNLGEYILSSIRYAAMPEMEPVALANLGIAILVLTPFVRVCFSFLFFAFGEKNRKFTAITGFVLLVLTIVLFLP